MSRLNIKDIHPVFYYSDGRIQIGDEAGFSSEIVDEDGFVKDFFQYLNGEFDVEGIFAKLHPTYQALTMEDVQGFIDALDENGHIEVLPSYDKENKENRYLSNLNYFLNFSSIHRSPQDLQNLIHQKSVGIVGLGGLGSNLLLQLAGLGFRKIWAIEPDSLETKNLNRQFLYRMEDIGAAKREAAVTQMKCFNPEVDLHVIGEKITSVEDLLRFFPDDLDLLICAADSPLLKIQSWCNQYALIRGIPLFGGGLGSTKGHFFTVLPGKTPCIDCFYRSLGADEQGKSHLLVLMKFANRNAAIGPTINLIASSIGLEILNQVLDLPVQSAGRLMSFDFLNFTMTPEDKWERHDHCHCQKKIGKPIPTFLDEIESEESTKAV